MSGVLPLFTLESRIKRRLRTHLRQIGFTKAADGSLVPPGDSKPEIRALHWAQRKERLEKSRDFVKKNWANFSMYFADGADVNPAAIQPRLEPISGSTWQSALFKLASSSWSVPVSEGFGRRMRFLVWDDSCTKLLGLIALGDPVFNLRVRDQAIGWDSETRKARLVHMMDAFVLGSLPPYNFLLGGKLVASLVKTVEIVKEFQQRYSRSRGIISGRRKHASLALITTTSALGRSSMYNRLSKGSPTSFKSIGYTSGWGHFHVPQDLFELMREYLAAADHRYASNNRFGDGPNWKFRAIRHVLGLLGLNRDMLRHGIGREVFIAELASNARAFLRGAEDEAVYDSLPTVAEVSHQAKGRWMQPRAERRPEYREWNHVELLKDLMPEISDGNDRVIAVRRGPNARSA